MSQASITRPGQPDKGVGMLPRIEHPLSRLGNPETMSVRGVSRAGSRTENDVEPEVVPHRGSVQRRSAQSRNSQTKKVFSPVPLEAIPEGVKVQEAADQTKPRLPVFGSNRNFSRAESRASNGSRMSTMSRPSTRTRIEIDELEAILKEKFKSGGFFAVRQMFKNNDPEGRGNVTTEALLHILTSILGRLISPKQYHMLLKRLHLDEKTVIKFDEFYSQFRDSVSSEYPRWLDPIARKQIERSQMSASQVHAQLKEHAKQRFLDLADLVPQMNPGGSENIIQPEFRNVLNKLGFFMDEQEFDKLWKKYDVHNLGVIKAPTLLKKLGIEFRERGTPPEKGALDSQQDTKVDKSTPPKSGKSITPPPSVRSLPRSEAERRTSINIEKWLKDKFREGFNVMRSEFRKGDPQRTGRVTRESFRRVLAQFDLYLREDSALNMFLARCGLPERGDINYEKFLTKFQDRSEDGVPHAILSNPEHRFNKDPRAVTPKSTVTAVESKMMTLFQSNFLALLGMFHKIDKHHQDIISQQEFRAAIESRFQIEMNDQEFESFMENVPLDKDGNVRYPDFMAQFDAKKGAPSLWEGKSVVSAKASRHQSVPKSEQPRIIEELHEILRDFVKNDMNKLETEFRKLDEYNSGRLTQEMMYQLLQNMNIQTPLTRGEIRRLWDTYIINKNRTFTFLELIRFYGYSQKSAAFPNAKISPPRRGDNDFMMRSRKLNCDADMLEDNLRAKVDYMWEDLRREFVDMDPYHTGFVSREEFRDLLIELCVHLTNHEAQMLCDRFDTNKDGRVSYIEFLKPFALRRQVWREGNNMLSVLTHPQAELPTSMIPGKPIAGLENVTSKLRQQLAGDWRTLRRAFKKMDVSSDGMLTLPEFRSVLKLCNIVLDEDEVYHVLSQYDKDLQGKVDYKKFMTDTVGRPETQKSKV